MRACLLFTDCMLSNCICDLLHIGSISQNKHVQKSTAMDDIALVTVAVLLMVIL